MTDVILTGTAGVVLSVLFEYVPGLSEWYNKLKDNSQRLIMLGLLVLTAAVIFGLNCAGWFGGKIPAVSCSDKGLQDLIWLLVVAVAANQGTHKILPR